MTDQTAGRRSGGRAGRRALRAAAAIRADAYLTRTMKPVEILGDEGLSIIEDNAETILAEDPGLAGHPALAAAVRRRLDDEASGYLSKG